MATELRDTLKPSQTGKSLSSHTPPQIPTESTQTQQANNTDPPVLPAASAAQQWAAFANLRSQQHTKPPATAADELQRAFSCTERITVESTEEETPEIGSPQDATFVYGYLSHSTSATGGRGNRQASQMAVFHDQPYTLSGQANPSLDPATNRGKVVKVRLKDIDLERHTVPTQKVRLVTFNELKGVHVEELQRFPTVIGSFIYDAQRGENRVILHPRNSRFAEHRKLNDKLNFQVRMATDHGNVSEHVFSFPQRSMVAGRLGISPDGTPFVYNLRRLIQLDQNDNHTATQASLSPIRITNVAGGPLTTHLAEGFIEHSPSDDFERSVLSEVGTDTNIIYLKPSSRYTTAADETISTADIDAYLRNTGSMGKKSRWYDLSCDQVVEVYITLKGGLRGQNFQGTSVDIVVLYTNEGENKQIRRWIHYSFNTLCTTGHQRVTRVITPATATQSNRHLPPSVAVAGNFLSKHACKALSKVVHYPGGIKVQIDQHQPDGTVTQLGLTNVALSIAVFSDEGKKSHEVLGTTRNQEMTSYKSHSNTIVVMYVPKLGTTKIEEYLQDLKAAKRITMETLYGKKDGKSSLASTLYQGKYVMLKVRPCDGDIEALSRELRGHTNWVLPLAALDNNNKILIARSKSTIPHPQEAEATASLTRYAMAVGHSTYLFVLRDSQNLEEAHSLLSLKKSSEIITKPLEGLHGDNFSPWTEVSDGVHSWLVGARNSHVSSQYQLDDNTTYIAGFHDIHKTEAIADLLRNHLVPGPYNFVSHQSEVGESPCNLHCRFLRPIQSRRGNSDCYTLAITANKELTADIKSLLDNIQTATNFQLQILRSGVHLLEQAAVAVTTPEESSPSSYSPFQAEQEMDHKHVDDGHVADDPARYDDFITQGTPPPTQLADT